MNILVLDFNGMGLREISIKGISMIFYISVGHDSTIYVANTVGTLCSVEDETRNISLITSPESGNSMDLKVCRQYHMFILFNSLHYVQLNTMIDSPRLFATNNLEQFLLKQIARIL
jgi:hypothetical protein